MPMLACPNGHVGTLVQRGRDDDGNLLVSCDECNTLFSVDDSGDEHERVSDDAASGETAA